MDSRPVSRASGTGITTSGTAVAIPDGSASPWYAATQFKLWVSAEAFVGLGGSSSPAAASTTNSVIQQAGTEEVYTIPGWAEDLQDFVWIYAASGTTDYDLSFFG